MTEGVGEPDGVLGGVGVLLFVDELDGVPLVELDGVAVPVEGVPVAVGEAASPAPADATAAITVDKLPIRPAEGARL